MTRWKRFPLVQLGQQLQHCGFPIARTAPFLSCRRDVRRQLGGSGGNVRRGDDYQTNPSDFRISLAQHLLLLTDEALAKEGYTDPAAAQAERVRRFRQWVAEHTVPNTFEGDPPDGKPVLRFNFSTSLLQGGLFSQVIQQGYDRFWLLKLSAIPSRSE